MFVDAAGAGDGNGTVENPFSDLVSALEGFSLSLNQASPCIGAGEGGATMGANTGGQIGSVLAAAVMLSLLKGMGIV